jgi:hypothetical protein
MPQNVYNARFFARFANSHAKFEVRGVWGDEKVDHNRVISDTLRFLGISFTIIKICRQI